MRPALYQAWQDIVPVVPKDGQAVTYDLVGPICETGDFLGKDRSLVIEENDLLAVRSAGAYGFVMSSTIILELVLLRLWLMVIECT